MPITLDKAASEAGQNKNYLIAVLDKRQSAPSTKPEVKQASEKQAKIK
jgi:hypothetical protein